MWTKTRKALMERTADCLKTRVRYNFEVYTTTKLCHWREMPVFYLYVDNELWFASNPHYFCAEHHYINENVDRSLPRDEYWKTYSQSSCAAVDYASSLGFMDVDQMMGLIHKYFNVFSIAECLHSSNYILRMLAVLDRRIGKRTVKQLVEGIRDEPEWIRKYILLRAEGEGIQCLQSDNFQKHCEGIQGKMKIAKDQL